MFLLTWPTLFYGPDPTDFISKLVDTELKGRIKMLYLWVRTASLPAIEQFCWDLMERGKKEHSNQCLHEITYQKIKVCENTVYAPGGNKVQKAILASLTLVSLERGSLVRSMHAKYEVSIAYGSKVIAKVKVDNRQTDRQINKQTDRTKTICPRSFDPGA